VEYHDKNYAQAAAYFKLGQDRQNYSKAFSKYRSQVIVDHFGEIAAVLLALAGALLVLAICLRLRRKYREIVDSVMHGDGKNYGKALEDHAVCFTELCKNLEIFSIHNRQSI
jgi:hypothetical protein